MWGKSTKFGESDFWFFFKLQIFTDSRIYVFISDIKIYFKVKLLVKYKICCKKLLWGIFVLFK